MDPSSPVSVYGSRLTGPSYGSRLLGLGVRIRDLQVWIYETEFIGQNICVWIYGSEHTGLGLRFWCHRKVDRLEIQSQQN